MEQRPVVRSHRFSRHWSSALHVWPAAFFAVQLGWASVASQKRSAAQFAARGVHGVPGPVGASHTPASRLQRPGAHELLEPRAVPHASVGRGAAAHVPAEPGVKRQYVSLPRHRVVRPGVVPQGAPRAGRCVQVPGLPDVATRQKSAEYRHEPRSPGVGVWQGSPRRARNRHVPASPQKNERAHRRHIEGSRGNLPPRIHRGGGPRGAGIALRWPRPLRTSRPCEVGAPTTRQAGTRSRRAGPCQGATKAQVRQAA